MSPALRRGLPALLAVVLSLGAYAHALAPDRQLAARDLLHLFYPLGKHVAEHGATARDPTRGLGVALAADPLAWSYYPPRLVHHVGGYDLGFKLALALHGALAGVGAYVLARQLGASRRASVLAVVGAVLAGPTLSLHRHPNLLAGAAWAPFAVAGFQRGLLLAARREAWRWHALAGASVGLMVLAGGIELVLGLALVLGAGALASVLGRPALARRRLVAPALLAPAVVLALGLGVGAVQLVPTARSLPETTRPGAVNAREASRWSLPRGRLVALANRAWDRGEASPFGDPFSASVYLGRAVVALAALAALRGDRAARGLAAGVGLVLVASLGSEGHLFTALRWLPGFDRFRYPEKLLLLAAVLAPALSARGLMHLLGRSPRALAKMLAVALMSWQAVDLLRDARELLPAVPVALVRAAPETVALVGTGRCLAGPAVLRQPATADFLARNERKREVLLGGLAGLFGVEDASHYGPFTPVRLRALLEATEAREGFFDLACVTGVIARRGGPLSDVGAVAPLSSELVVARVAGGPRARLVPRARRVATLEEAQIRVAMSRSFDDEAVFEGDLPELATAATGGTAEVRERDGDHVLVATDAPGERLLLLSELYLRGVAATVDGRPVDVVPACIALVGVPVPAGQHRVLVTWHVPGLPLGAGLAAAALAVVVVLVRFSA